MEEPQGFPLRRPKVAFVMHLDVKTHQRLKKKGVINLPDLGVQNIHPP